MTWRDWERCEPFRIKNHALVYPLYSWGAPSDKSTPGGKIEVYDIDVAPENCEERDALRHRIGFLSWHRDEIEYVTVDEEWQRQGVATEMLRVARIHTPTLRHGNRRTRHAHAWISTVDPTEARPQDDDPPERQQLVESRPSWLSRLSAVIRVLGKSRA